ncbi:putative transcriptional regulator medusa protein [Daldinia childiae]|uniref:putative transcriptional regulator medusa protein n=1 Tax=Daldinia childiae TaxID=326645 RepID=UPI0014484841|nr:putative transcriptional regulator medusa protein [Daldinia childiae]KAF3065912.1 putative transcriptional regulator medusa protein [Daldinia childiae]
MSAVKFEYPTYKLFEPQYHPQRPIIVDTDALESPETVILRYEEEAAARANGGDLRGDSPPGLLSMSTYSKPQPPQMHAFDSSRSYQDPHYQYSAQQFATQQPENAAAQLNQMAFAANGSAGQYMTPIVATLISYQPTAGIFGTKVLIKISAPYDLIAITSHFYLAFGSHKSPAHAVRDTSDASGFGYAVSGDAPQLEDTRSPSPNVPLSLLIESAAGQTLATIDVGTFTYHDTAAGSADGPPEDVTRAKRGSRSPEQREVPTKQQEQDHMGTESATNTYGYAPTAPQTVASNYDTSYSNNDNMIGTYHRSSYAIDYPRPPPLKTPSWNSYGHSISARSPITGVNHTTISRPRVASGPTGGGQLNPYALYSTKAVLKINGDLESMVSGWTQDEWEDRRRIVMFSKKQQGSTLSTSFKAVPVNERPQNGIFVYRRREKSYRRNLEGFRPLTVSKAKPETEEFFKIIMGYSVVKPRNIEKDVKVFPWKILSSALKKIISKYSASPSSTVPPGPGPTLLTPEYPRHGPRIPEEQYPLASSPTLLRASTSLALLLHTDTTQIRDRSNTYRRRQATVWLPRRSAGTLFLFRAATAIPQQQLLPTRRVTSITKVMCTALEHTVMSATGNSGVTTAARDEVGVTPDASRERDEGRGLQDGPSILLLSGNQNKINRNLERGI